MNPDEPLHGSEGRSECDLSPLWKVWSDGTVDGLQHRIAKYVKRKFPSVSHNPEFVNDVIGEAFDSAVSSINRGGEIRHFPKWFYKTVRRVAAKRLGQIENVDFGVDVDATPDTKSSDPFALKERERQDERNEALVQHALAHAHKMLPRVGTGQVRDVMEIFLEAVRNGLPDYPPSEIAKALGIPESSARTLLHRGLTRLHREAEREGVSFPSDLAPEIHEPYGTLDPERWEN